jgi:ribosomal peptide maturation radical SAM protein 1
MARLDYYGLHSRFIMDPIRVIEPAEDESARGRAEHRASTGARRRLSRVALVSMPFVSVAKPSLQLGLLKSIATAHGFEVTNFELSLDFARQIGVPAYEALANHRGYLLGDWLFSAAAFGVEAPDPHQQFLGDFGSKIRRELTEFGTDPLGVLRELRCCEVPRYLKRLMNTIDWGKFGVVGFTSTFQQSVASFALAARIKARYAQVCTLFGGANFDGEMGRELVRSVECIDYAISGEADLAFPEFLEALEGGRDPAEVAGVVCRRGDEVANPGPPRLFTRMDDLPTPDYDDYFERAEALGLLGSGPRNRVPIPFESARGCWWGQKHHCTFCGLNADGMAFRAKSPERLLSELSELARRYRTFRFEAVDNILSMSYLESFLPRLVKEDYHYCLFYETKANLRRDQIKLLSEAGVRSIQPGIESLSSKVLALMDKGVTASANVNLLRWAAYYNISVTWNIIWGFPGETEADSRAQTALLPHLTHLQPPLSAARIWMERYSPIFFDRERFPVRRVAPETSYFYVYPRRMQHERLAYFFDYEFAETMPDAVYESLESRVRTWQSAWERPVRPTMTFRHSPGLVQIDDRRACGETTTYTLTGPLAELYAASSDRPQRAAGLKPKLGIDWSTEKIETTLDRLCDRGITMRDGDMFLSLALPAGAATP